MALNDTKTFNAAARKVGVGDFNFGSDSIKVALISDAYSSVDVTLANPVLTSFTEVAGGSYASKVVPNTAWALTGDTAKLTGDDLTGANQWPIDASGPTDIRCALVYNETATQAALQVVDLTEDGGVTPVSLQADAIGIQWNQNRLLTIQILPAA